MHLKLLYKRFLEFHSLNQSEIDILYDLQDINPLMLMNLKSDAILRLHKRNNGETPVNVLKVIRKIQILQHE